MVENSNKKSLNYQLTLLKFVEQPFTKSTKAIGLYSITEDYFEKDVNSVFCKNTEFIEAGKTIGLLNLEKEITGDIVQGLPRIEEILDFSYLLISNIMYDSINVQLQYSSGSGTNDNIP